MRKKSVWRRSVRPKKMAAADFGSPSHIRLLLFFCLMFVFGLFFFQSHSWFFFITGKEQIDFASASGNADPTAQTATFLGQTLPVPPIQLAQSSPINVLGDETGSDKRIEVNLTTQTLYAYEGTRQVYQFPISSGKWFPTPTGTFYIWIKLESVRMRGGSKALGTYYDLPNVPFTMFFYNDKYPKWQGYSIHGTYWHNNFGHPMSHGCVNMRPDDARTMYFWANPMFTNAGQHSIQATETNPGTPVIIYGTTPAS